MQRLHRTLLAITLSATAPACVPRLSPAAWAADPGADRPSAIQVDHAWARPAIAGHTGVAYLTVTDSGAPDTLTGVASPIAEMAMLHESYGDHGVARMRDLDHVAVAPDHPAVFAPGGMHVMLMGLKRKLAVGDRFPLVLTFAHAGTVTATVTVEGLARH